MSWPVIPPSANIFAPVMQQRSLRRKADLTDLGGLNDATDGDVDVPVFQICVFNKPGERQLTRIPSLANSTAMLLLSPTTPHFAASYGPEPGKGSVGSLSVSILALGNLQARI